MDFGITIATAADSWQVVKRAEELGYTHAWFYDTQMLNADPFVAMAVAAVHTQKIHLGTGVLVPSNRLAPVTANCLASLNKLAPGRIHCGLGTGFTALLPRFRTLHPHASSGRGGTTPDDLLGPSLLPPASWSAAIRGSPSGSSVCANGS